MDKKLVSYYKVLELALNAAPEEVQKAYRELVQIWHPDRFPAGSALEKRANGKLKEINHAYAAILEFNQRAHTASVSGLATESMRSPDLSHVDANTVCDPICMSTDQQVRPWTTMAEEHRKEIVRVLYHRLVHLVPTDEILWHGGVQVRGIAGISERRVLISRPNAAVMTPLFLFAHIFVRDIITMPGHRDRRNQCLMALGHCGYSDARIPESESYLAAERQLAGLISSAILTKLTAKENPFGDWARDLKSWWRLKGRDFSMADVVNFLAALAIHAVPYWTRSEWAQSFPPEWLAKHGWVTK